MANQDMNITIKAFDKTKKGFGSVTRGIKAVAGAALNLKTALIGTAGIAGMGLLVKSSLDATDSLGKTARKIGVTTEALAKMRYAASLTGVETSTMDMALQRFTRRAAEAAMGTGEAKDALKELNLDAKALINMPLEQQMQELAGAFETVKTDADKVRLAMKLFDSEGVALVNTLGLGKKGLIEMAAEADRLGVALSATAVEGVEDANDAFTRLSTLFRGIRDQTTAALAPALETLATTLKDKVLTAIESTDGGVEQFAKNLAIRILDAVEATLRGLQELVNGVIGTFNDVRRAASEFSGFFKEDDEKNALQLESAMEKINEKMRDRQKLIDEETNKSTYFYDLAQKKDAEKLANLQKLLDARKEAGDYGLTNEVDFAERISETFATLREEILATKEVEKGEGEEEQDPVVAKQEENTALQELQAGHNAAMAQGDAQATATTKKNQIAKTKSVLGGLAEQLKGSSVIQKKMGMIEKAKAIKTALISTYEATSKAFANGGGFPLGIPMAAASLAQGLANVAMIKSQSFEGGGFTGHGSRTGGVDGKGGFPAILHPNETVIDHTKGGGRSGGGKTVIVNQTLNITTGVEQTVRAEIMNMLPQIQDAAKSAVAMEVGRGGSYSSMITGR